MAIILSTKNIPILVDNEDYELLNQYNWTVTLGYAVRHGKVNGKYKTIYMHRFINNTPDGLETDHINRDKLDNRKCNLRSASKSLNNFNKNIQSNNSSGIRGVNWYKRVNKWRAYIKKDNINIHLGYFNTLAEAIKVRIEQELILFSEIVS